MGSKTLFVSDLDGTLLNEHAMLSDYTKEIVNQLTEHGVLFTYATARSYSSASQLLTGMNLVIPAITYNGTFFVKQEDGEIIDSVLFPTKEIEYLAQSFQKQKMSPLVYSFLDGKERVSWRKGCETKGILRYLKSREDDPRLRPVSSEAELYQGEVFYFTLIGEKQGLTRMKESFEAEKDTDLGFLALLQEEIYRKEEYWLEIMPKGASKAEGAKRLMKLLGCDQLVCFGDGINDISLFEIADRSYAVENAVLELKKLATGIIGENTKDGVARWFAMQNLFEAKSK